MDTIKRRPFADEDLHRVQEEIISQVESDPEKFIAAYKQLDRSYGGRYINSDLMKETFPHFGTKEERNRYNAALHNSAAVLAGELFKRTLEEDKRAGRSGDGVTLVTGVPGAGKTTMIQARMKMESSQGGIRPLIYEGMFVNAEVAMETVQGILDAGFRPEIVVVHNTATKALENTLARFEKTGRGGSTSRLAMILDNIPASLAKVEEKYGDAVNLVIRDHRNLPDVVESRGWQHRALLKSEGNYEQIRDRLFNHLERLEREGRVSPAAAAQARADNQRGAQRGIQQSHADVGRQSEVGRPDNEGHDRKARGSSEDRGVLSGPASRRLISEPERVAAALNYIDPRDRETWVKMAFAVKDGLGDAGFDTWDQWSQGAGNYDRLAAMAVWKSAKSGSITVGSLYYEARQNGYQIKPEGPQIKAGRANPNPQVKEDDRLQREAQAVVLANKVLAASGKAAADHPYLHRKGVVPDGQLCEMGAENLRSTLGYLPKQNGEPLSGRILVVPIRHEKGLSSLEFIDEHGRKSALAGGRKAGAWVEIGNAEGNAGPGAGHPPKEIYIAEGVATAMSIKQALGDEVKVVAALSDTNLKNVAMEMRKQSPGGQVVVCADLGSEKKAMEAAAAILGQYAVPEFTSRNEAIARPKDFNDMMILEGSARVRNQLGDTRQPQQSRIDEGQNFNTRKHIEGVETTAILADGIAVVKTGKGVNMANEAPEAKGQEPVQRERKPVGDYVLQMKDIPQETRDLAKSYFGARTNIYAAKENGGPYKGEVYNTEKYLIQEIGNRSVVIHDKSKMEFTQALDWMNKNQRLNGHELQVYYDGDKAKTFPYDRQRDNLERAVASLSKSAKELGMDGMDKTLKDLQAKSWERVKDIREVEKAKRTIEKAAKKEAPEAPKAKEAPEAPKAKEVAPEAPKAKEAPEAPKAKSRKR